MVSTLLLGFGILGLLVLSLLLHTFFLRLGLHWIKVPHVTIKRALFAVVLVELAHRGILFVSGWMVPRTPGGSYAILAGVFLLSMLTACAIIARLFATTFARSFVAWLATVIPSLGMLLLITFAIKPYGAEAFVITANSMAPTLLGERAESTCEQCGEVCYFSNPDEMVIDEINPLDMICAKFHRTRLTAPPENRTLVRARDRILITKFLQPRRWDLVAFRFPGDQSVVYVKRLVGLPGETITIKEGRIHANGQLLSPPAELQGIEYLSEMPFGGYSPPLWGTEARPAVLGAEEYFVLGDFSARSKDSRLWEQGAAGHPPYAVPGSHMLGVATHIYWPLERVRGLR